MTQTALRERTRSTRGHRAADVSAFTVSRLPPDVRIEVLRKGFGAREVSAVALRMGWTREHASNVLRIKRATLTRKLRNNDPLTTADSERLLSVTDMIEQVQQMVERSGNPEGFDSAKWLAEWLDAPNPALGGRAPAQYLDTNEGVKVVRQILAQMESGAYA